MFALIRFSASMRDDSGNLLCSISTVSRLNERLALARREARSFSVAEPPPQGPGLATASAA